MDASWHTPAKEYKDCSVNWEGYGLVFADVGGILMVDYLQTRQTITINGTYYASRLRQLRENIKVKRHEKLIKGMLFYHDNAPTHTSVFAMTAISDCGFELIQHPLTWSRSVRLPIF